MCKGGYRRYLQGLRSRIRRRPLGGRGASPGQGGPFLARIHYTVAMRAFPLLLLVACGSTPVVTLSSPTDSAALIEGAPIPFVATITDDDALDTLRYQLLAEPGGALDFTASFAGDEATLLFSRSLLPGPATVTLSAIDPAGHSGHDDVSFTVVSNTSPTLDVTTTATRIAVGVALEVTIEAADVDDPDASLLTLTWDNATGPANPDASGVAVGSATWYTTGTETVTITATDPAGGYAIGTLTVDVYGDDDDADGYTDVASGGDDCDDSDGAINPGADELCDGVDNDCDDAIDDGPADGTIWYADLDSDGWGGDLSVNECAAPAGYVLETGDCDDASASVNPGAVESCNGADDDCDDTIDEDAVDAGTWYADVDDDGYGDDSVTVIGCEGTGASAVGGDCDDTDPAVSPGATETCDAADVDEDCDGLADDDDTGASGRTTWYADTDGDGYGWSGSTRTACDAGGWVTDTTDCDDDRAATHPGATETCENGEDDDCDGSDPTCTLSGTVDLVDADGRWVGVGASDVTGASAALGDQDGDGLPELLIGAFSATSGAGAVYVAAADGTGTLNSAMGKRTGIAASDAAGFAVSGADIDGDGTDDLIVGAYGTDGGGTSSGGAYVVFGPVSGTTSLSSANATLIGETASDFAGWSVGAADTDGDGLYEAMIGATGQDAGGTTSGAVYLVEDPSGSLDLSLADAKLIGESASDYAGYSVAGLGDVDGDGLDDIAVGGPSSGTGAGMAWVLAGPVSGTIDLSAADATLTGVAGGDSTGADVARGGDVDGDGVGDLLVGAALSDGTGTEAGAAYLVLGPPSDSSLSAAEATFTGALAQDRAGSSLAGGGDADGDGFGDLLFGSPYEDTGGSNAGATWLVYGPSTGTISLSAADAMFVGETASDAAGSHVGFLDADGDGFDDLFLSATSYGGGEGAVYVVYGGGG
jgi:hypothetical protein